jgi:hypothetical protein
VEKVELQKDPKNPQINEIFSNSQGRLT